jgi:hypothetical protein
MSAAGPPQGTRPLPLEEASRRGAGDHRAR